MILFGVSLLFGRLILCTDLGLVLIEGWLLIGLIDLVLWAGFMYVVLDDFGLIFERIFGWNSR
jgi:hypothetical protein